MSAISCYFTQDGSFQSQQCQIHNVSERKCSSVLRFVGIDTNPLVFGRNVDELEDFWQSLWLDVHRRYSCKVSLHGVSD